MPTTDYQVPAWSHAFGKPLFQGRIKQAPSDFQVTEEPGFKRSGDGEHDFLWIEKSGANTSWVARALARHADIAARDVGFAGMKDRNAVTRQWFSVRRPAGGTDWASFSAPGVRILDTDRHARKLKRGAHGGNRFRIRVLDADVDRSVISARLETLGLRGVPNYFGAQRFGRNGNNLRLADDLFAGKRLNRERRGIALSAARAYIFNEVLSVRVAGGSWESALAGDALNLDGTASFFHAPDIDAALRARLCELDVHPTGVLWGKGEPECSAQALDIERTVVASNSALAAGLEGFGLAVARRALRTAVRDLQWELQDGVLSLEFFLGRGSYATSVLREIVDLTDA